MAAVTADWGMGIEFVASVQADQPIATAWGTIVIPTPEGRIVRNTAKRLRIVYNADLRPPDED